MNAGTAGQQNLKTYVTAPVVLFALVVAQAQTFPKQHVQILQRSSVIVRSYFSLKKS